MENKKFILGKSKRLGKEYEPKRTYPFDYLNKIQKQKILKKLLIEVQ